MARKRIVTRKIGNYTEAQMKEALQLILSGKSIRYAAKETNICFTTLRRYYNKLQTADSIENIRLVPHYDVNKVFSSEQEESLTKYYEYCAMLFYGLTTTECRIVAFQMAMKNNLKVPISWKENKMAGKEWLKLFRRRHPQLSLRKPEPCSLARATAFNRTNVAKFYDNLETVIQRNPKFSDGTRIYNLDETATTTVQKPQRVLASKGRKSLGKVTSGEKGTLVTTCCIVNASGQALPPVLVFPRKNFKIHMMKGTPTGSLGLAASTGWMNTELFVEVIKHFVKYTNSSIENPNILIMDNPESHLSIEALDMAKTSGITILTLHPHTSAKLQPLDVGVFGPFKTFYNSALESWMLRNPGKPVTIYEVGEFVGTAFLKAMTPVNIVNAFKKTSIFPFDKDLFTDEDFMPSSVTDRPCPDCQVRLDTEDTLFDAQQAGSSNLSQETNKENYSEDLVNKSCNSNTSSINKSHEEESSKLAQIKPEDFVSPFQFRDPIKAGPRKSKRKPRKLGRSMIVTDSPEKAEIEVERATTKRKKECKKPARKILRSDSKNKRK